MIVKEMLEKRAGLIEQARGFMDKAKTEKREPTAEERAAFDKAMDDAATLKANVDRVTRLEGEEKELRTVRERRGELETAEKNKGDEQRSERRVIELRPSVSGVNRSITIECNQAMIAEQRAFSRLLLDGPKGLSGEEIRALQKDRDTGGGYLSAPMEFKAQLIQKLDDDVIMRQIGNVLPPVTTADSLGFPTLENDPDDADWTTELGTGNEDSTMSFGRREFKPEPAAKRLKISETLVRRSGIPVDGLVKDRLGYKFGITQEKGYLNGSGAKQPLGVFTASDQGISTGRDVSTDNTTTAMTFNGLKNAEFFIKAGYRRRASWLFHRDGIRELAKIVDGEGRYIWAGSVVAGRPDMLLNMPFYESEYVPNTFETGLYVGILGDFSYYWIVDALTFTIKVLAELYAETNQIGYIGRFESDGMPILEEAFARVKLG